MEKDYYVYIMSNRRRTVLYTGVTNDLKKRAYEHREKLVDGFTKKCNVDQLVYYEIAQGPEPAIQREKQIKAGSRARKLALINRLNPDWKDLYDDI
jgi:putative endonuclease